MKKFICLILIIACLFSLSACNSASAPKYEGDYISQVYDVVYHKPENLLLNAPRYLMSDWDFKSIRDPYAEISLNDYNMPVYKIDTYERFLHFKDIVGKSYISEITPNVNEENRTIEYFDYRGGTFDTYTLLVGWFTVETHHTIDCYTQSIEYQTNNGNLSVSLHLAENCSCSQDSEEKTVSALVLVAVPKEELDLCTGISFVLKDCFSNN